VNQVKNASSEEGMAGIINTFVNEVISLIKKINISEKAVFKDLDVSDKEEALKVMSEAFLENGFVNEGYYQSILDREKKAPTGIEAYDYGIAIPHTDPKFVNEDSLGVAVLKDPIIFN